VYIKYKYFYKNKVKYRVKWNIVFLFNKARLYYLLMRDTYFNIYVTNKRPEVDQQDIKQNYQINMGAYIQFWKK